MNSENYGTHIKHIRQKMGLTQNQVAEALGVTPGYISNVENNRTAMSLRILTYYAKLCGCSLDSLVGTLDPEYSETALDRKLYNAIMQLDVDTKEKLLKTIELWNLQSRLACMGGEIKERQHVSNNGIRVAHMLSFIFSLNTR